MAARSFLLKNQRILSPLFRCSQFTTIRPQVVTYSNKPSSKETDDTIDNEPVPFSTSKAAEFNSAENTENMGRSNKPKFEPLIVKISLFAFLLYFLVLREESDWDKNIAASLTDTVPDMELIMLRNKRKVSSESDPFTEADLLRLKELEKELSHR